MREILACIIFITISIIAVLHYQVGKGTFAAFICITACHDTVPKLPEHVMGGSK